MDERGATRQELVLKVLGWGTVVYFLITGYALDQHALFELRSPPGSVRLQQAQIAHADALDAKARSVARSDPVHAADLTAKAAKIRFDVDNAAKERSDSRYRAIALIGGALLFAVLYPLLILATYRRTTFQGAQSSDLISLRAALIYGIAMSVITTTAAVSTAYQ